MMNETVAGERTPVGGLYLIAMTEMVIAEDLRGAILEREPGAVIKIAASLAEAEQALSEAHLPLRGAFLEASPAEYARSALEAAMRSAQRKAVLLGDMAEVQGASETYLVLMRPFSTEDVHRLLEDRVAS